MMHLLICYLKNEIIVGTLKTCRRDDLLTFLNDTSSDFRLRFNLAVCDFIKLCRRASRESKNSRMLRTIVLLH